MPNKKLSLAEGAIQPWVRAGSSSPWFGSLLESLARAHRFSTKKPVKELPNKVIDLLMYGNKGRSIKMRHKTQRGRTFDWDTTFEGVINNLERRYGDTESDYVRSEIERYMAQRKCADCNGQRLKPEVLAVTVGGDNIIDVTSKSVSSALSWTYEIVGEKVPVDPSTNGAARPKRRKKRADLLSDREQAIASQIRKEIQSRLKFLVDIGLDYLTLERTASTLSGGEAQRIRLATQIGSGLMGVLYVCDEPSVGLHPVDDHRLIGTLKRLRDLGNTVLIVEHDEAIMRARRLHRRPRSGRRRARWRGHCDGRSRGHRRVSKVADGPVPQQPATDSHARVQAAGQSRRAGHQGRSPEQSEKYRRDHTSRQAGLYYRCVGLRQEHSDQRGPAQEADPILLPCEGQARRKRRRREHRRHRQGRRHRPVAYWPDAPQ